MNKLLTMFGVSLMGLVVLVATGPILIALAHSLVPLVLVGGLVWALLRAVWYFTRDR